MSLSKVVCPVVAVMKEEGGYFKASRPKTAGAVAEWYEWSGPILDVDVSPLNPSRQLGWLDERIAQVTDFLTKLKGMRNAIVIPEPPITDIRTCLHCGATNYYRNGYKG